MSGAAPDSTEQRVQEDLLRLDAYRGQLNAMLQQHQFLSSSRLDHLRAREALDAVDRLPPGSEILIPLGGETMVRGTADRGAPVLVGIGSGIAVEMERAKVIEILSQRTLKIEEATQELEGNMQTLEERIQQLSARVDQLTRQSGADGALPSGDVGSDQG